MINLILENSIGNVTAFFSNASDASIPQLTFTCTFFSLKLFSSFLSHLLSVRPLKL